MGGKGGKEPLPPGVSFSRGDCGWVERDPLYIELETLYGEPVGAIGPGRDLFKLPSTGLTGAHRALPAEVAKAIGQREVTSAPLAEINYIVERLRKQGLLPRK